jgi:hypothetical protein
MGYCTWFTGHFKLDRQLALHHLAYLQAFHEEVGEARLDNPAQGEI